MLDAKILSAVLASLAAVAAGMNGGAVDAQDLQSGDVSTDTFNFGDSSNPLSIIKNLLNTRPEPKNAVRAELTVNNLYAEKVSGRESILSIDNYTEFDMGTRSVKSDEEIVFHGFTGDLQPGNETKIQGTAFSLITSGVNVSGMVNLQDSTSSETITLEDNRRTSLTFSQVRGNISSETMSTLQMGNAARPLSINSFSGDITVYPGNKTVILDGKVDRLEAGDFSFGG